MKAGNTLPDSYQQRVYTNTLATVKRQIHQAENPTPAVVISVEVAWVDNAILPDNLTSEVVLEEPEIGNTDPNIPIDNYCTYDQSNFGMPEGSGDYENDGDESDERDAIPTAGQRCRAESELVRFDVGI